MFQAGLVPFDKNHPDGLFRRIKSDPRIIDSCLLVDCRDHIRMARVPAFDALKPISLAIRLTQITASGTGLRAVCRIDLLSTASCRRRLEADPFPQRVSMPITLIVGAVITYIRDMILNDRPSKS